MSIIVRFRPAYLLRSRHWVRPLNTPAGVNNADDILSQSFSALDSIAGTETSLMASSTSHLTATSLSQLAPDISSMVIPPAQDPLLHYLTSSLTTHGHRARASKTVSRVLLWIHSFTHAPPLPILRAAISAASPAVRCMSQKQGAKMVHTPIPLNERQRTRYAVKWILDSSKHMPGRRVEERVARQIISILQAEAEGRTDSVLKQKEDVHKMATLNRGSVKRSGGR